MIIFSKRNKPFAWLLTSLGVVLVGLFQLAAPAIWAGEESAAVAENKSAPCKGLKPYNNLDELLYQFYINLDSDCLFEMPVAELEEIWGIKILTEERFKPKNYYPLAETDFYFKPYKSEKDAFYVERVLYNDKTKYMERSKNGQFSEYRYDSTIFKVKISKEYLKKHGTLFPNQRIPELLPNPSTSFNALNDSQICVFPLFSRDGSGDKNCSYPVWSSVDNKRSISLRDSNEIWFEVLSLIPENNSRDLPKEALSIDKNAPCRGLKPINDIDDLLYQFYINFDSECLFTMPITELEKAWNIKLYNQNSLNPERSSIVTLDDLNSSFEVLNFILGDNPENVENTKFSSYMPGDDNFGVKVYTTGLENNFTITMTKAYKDTHDTFFPNNKFYPLFLPTLEMEIRPYSGDPSKAYEEMKNHKFSEPSIYEKETHQNPFDLNFSIEHLLKNDNNNERDRISYNKRIINDHIVCIFNSDKTRKICYDETSITINRR